MKQPKSDTFRIAVIARMKHGVLYEAIKKRCWTQKKAAEFLGVTPSGLGLAINLKGTFPHLFPEKLTPERQNRAREIAEKLMELTGMPVQDLFPEEFRTKEFLALPKLVERFADVPTRLLLEQAGMLSLPAAPDEELIAEEERNELQEVLAELSFPVRHAIQRVVFDGVSVKEAARERGIGTQAVYANIQTGIREARSSIMLRLARERRKMYLKTC